MKIGKIKVTFVFSGGGTASIKCKKWTVTKLTGSKGHRELTLTGADRNWSLDINDVVAITDKWVLF